MIALSGQPRMIHNLVEWTQARVHLISQFSCSNYGQLLWLNSQLSFKDLHFQLVSWLFVLYFPLSWGTFGLRNSLRTKTKLVSNTISPFFLLGQGWVKMNVDHPFIPYCYKWHVHEAEKKAQLRTLVTHPENLWYSAPTRQLTTVCTSSHRRVDTVFWSSLVPEIHLLHSLVKLLHLNWISFLFKLTGTWRKPS